MKYFKDLTEGSLLDPNNDGVSNDSEINKVKASMRMRRNSRMGRIFAPSIQETREGILASKSERSNYVSRKR